MSINISCEILSNNIAGFFNEKQRRILLASLAQASNERGSISELARHFSCSRQTIYAGLSELTEPEKLNELLESGVRSAGAGRTSAKAKYPELLATLENLVSPHTRGNPECPLIWTTKSLRHLSSELKKQGCDVSYVTVGNMLVDLGYTLQSNKKSHEHGDGPDRDAQFQHINNAAMLFMNDDCPVISVDCKKKENVGNFKNNGQEYEKSGEPRKVEVYDFPGLKASPYGVYDVGANEGWVNVGITHDTASFAVHSIRQWWINMGSKRYPDSKIMYICADGGGSNGSRNRLWKRELQSLANQLEMKIVISHFPPGTSKWNKIEHRMFSAITTNWRGRPLETLEVIVNLIKNTTNNGGLKIGCSLDTNLYTTGIKVADEEMSNLNILGHDFHPEWNYLICPNVSN